MSKINVTACDNELIIIATTPAGTSEICHISSGYNNPVSYVVDLAAVLPRGSYSVTMIGINWGGPGKFAVAIDSTPYTYSDANAPIGVCWSKTVPVTF